AVLEPRTVLAGRVEPASRSRHPRGGARERSAHAAGTAAGDPGDADAPRDRSVAVRRAADRSAVVVRAADHDPGRLSERHGMDVLSLRWLRLPADAHQPDQLVRLLTRLARILVAW